MKQAKNINDFVYTIFNHATIPGRTTKIKGESICKGRGRSAVRYQFIATLSSGTNDTKQEYEQFKEIYIRPNCKDGKRNKKQEINNQLIKIAGKLQKLYPPRISGRTLETTLNKQRGILTIHPFQ
ncbi:hypothetical protein HN903_03195 [archaeon]|nr:hypothetical protein [archaeon]MBT7128736.1 hypothetical protein [archaeon]